MGFGWSGITLGLVLGFNGDKPDDGNGGGVGGTKSNDDVADPEGGGNIQYAPTMSWWIYGGGVAGLGRHFGPYGTGGLMVGPEGVDIGVGMGAHFGRRFGVGVITPLGRTIHKLNEHADKAGALFERGQEYMTQLAAYIPDVSGALERLV